MEKQRLKNMYEEVKITEKKIQERTRGAQLANQPWKGIAKRRDKQYTETSEERKQGRVSGSRFSVKELLRPLQEPIKEEGLWLKFTDKKRSLSVVGVK